MDPDEALAALHEAITEFNELSADNFVDQLRAADSIVEHFTALDEWIKQGGFLPSEWQDDKREKRTGTFPTDYKEYPRG